MVKPHSRALHTLLATAMLLGCAAARADMLYEATLFRDSKQVGPPIALWAVPGAETVSFTGREITYVASHEASDDGRVTKTSPGRLRTGITLSVTPERSAAGGAPVSTRFKVALLDLVALRELVVEGAAIQIPALHPLDREQQVLLSPDKPVDIDVGNDAEGKPVRMSLVLRSGPR